MSPALPPLGLRQPAPRWLAWLWAGVSHEANANTQRKVMQANASAALTMLIVLGFNLVYTALGNPALMRSGWAQLPFALLAPLVWALNRRGRLFAARWTVFALAMSGTFAVILGGQGTAAGAHVFYLMFAVMPAMFYSVAEWRSSALLFAVNLGIYAWLETAGWPPHPDLWALDPAVLRGLRVALLASCIFVVVGVVALSEHTADATERRLKLLASTDPLTGLPNRRAFRHGLAVERRRAQRSGKPLCLAIIDLDHFKSINDSLGHDAGDLALQHVAQVLADSVRAHDLVARVGGEEFALLMPDTALEQALQGLERLRAAVAARPFEYRGQAHRITVSAGVLEPAPGQSEDEALRAVDQALYRAKREGRDRVQAAG